MYGSHHAIIAVPQRPQGKPSVIAIGKVGKVNVSVLVIDLNTTDLTGGLGRATEQLMERVAPHLRTGT